MWSQKHLNARKHVKIISYATPQTPPYSLPTLIDAALATCTFGRPFFTYNVTQNVVYVTASLSTLTRVYALNMDTGKELWAQPYMVSTQGVVGPAQSHGD